MKSKRILVFFIAFAMLLGNMSQAFAIGTSPLSLSKAPKAYSLKKAHSPRRAPVATVNQDVTISIGQLRGIDGNDFNWDILPSGKLTVKAYYKSGEKLIYSDSVEFTKNDTADKNVVMTIPSNADSIDSFGIASDINDNVKINATVTSGAGAAEHDGIYTLKFDVTQTASPVIDVKWQDPYGNAIEGVDGGKISITVGEGEDASTAKPMLPSRAKQINLLTDALDYTEYGDIENKTLSKIDTVDIDGNVALDISLDGQTNSQGNITLSGTSYKYIQNYDPQKGASILLISQPVVLEPNKDGDGKLPAVPDGYHRLTFDATNEGKIGTEQTKVIDVLKGTKYNNATLTAKLATIVAVPNSAEKVFDTWAPKVPNDETVVDKYMPDGATAAVGTYIAKYVDKKNVLENDPQDDNYVELKFNSGDGHFGNDKTDKVRTLYVLQSKKWSVIKNDPLVKKYMPPENVGLTAPAKKMFDAWSKDKKLVDDAVMKDLSDAERTLTAKYRDEIIGPVDPKVTPNPDENKYWTVTFKSADEKTGTVAEKNTYYVDKKSGKTLADVTTPKTTPAEGYSFEKWTPALDNKTKVDKNLTVTGTFTKDVIGPVDPDKKPNPDEKKYWTVTFKSADENTGTVAKENTFYVDKKSGKTLADVTAPKTTPAEGYSFEKWTPALDNKTAVEKDLTVTGTFTKDVVISDKDVIPFDPKDPKKPSDPKDPNIPTKDDEGKTIEREKYVVIGFNTDGNGTVNGKPATSFLVKKGVTFDKITVPTLAANANYKFDKWSPALAEKNSKVEKDASYKATFNQIETSATPVINQPTEGETTITGTATPNATVTVTTPEGEKTTTADNNGNWTVTVTTPLEKDQVITAKATEEGKNPSKEANTTVRAKDTTPAPKINQPTEGETTITGTATPNATVTVTTPEGEKTTTADNDGNWTVTVTTPLVKEQVITAKATENGKKPSDEVTTTVKEKEKSKNPTITQPKAGDTTITGSATPGATVTVDTPEGPKTVTADANGNWTVTVTTPLEKDQIITATSTEEGKTPSDTVDATVIAGDLVSIIFDLNGGMIGSMTDSIKKMYNIGDKIVIMEAPQRKGYKFLYWKATENYNPGDTYKVVGEQTFVAQWEKLDSDKPNTGSSDNTGSKVTKPSAPNTGDQSDLYSYGLMTAIALLLLRGLRKKKCEF